MYEYIETYATAYNLQQTLQALPFAREKHKGQKRKVAKGNRQPYITHPLTMARHALSMGLTEDSLLAAILLHDVCEDCGVAPQELPVEAEVQEAVRLVTRVAGETKEKYYDQIRGNRIATLVSDGPGLFPGKTPEIYRRDRKIYTAPFDGGGRTVAGT